MTTSQRRAFLLGLLLVLAMGLISGGYWLYWRQVASRLQAGIEEWTADQRAAGATVDFQWQGIKGFPFAFTADFTAVNILGRLGGTSLSARTDHLRLNMSPLDLDVVRLLCNRPLTVIVPGLGFGQNGPASPNNDMGSRLVLDQTNGEIRLQNGNLAGTAINADKMKLDNGHEVFSAASLHLDVQLAPTLPHDFKDPAAYIEITVSGVDVPAGTPQLLPGPIIQAGMTGVVKGPLLPPAGAQPPPDLAGFLSQWRDAGGVLDLSNFNYTQGPLTLAGAGTFALDSDLQPIGAGKITASGLGDLVGLLSANGTIKRKDAAIAQAVIAGLQKPGTNGRPEVTIGLNIQDRVVSFGFARLFKLPPINWP